MAKLNRDWVVQPHGPLTRIAEGTYSVAGEIVMPLGRFPRRMTVVTLASGKLAVWSAIPLDEPGMAALDALGPVGFLIVPNQGHRLDVAAWQARYPDAQVIAPPRAHGSVEEAAPVAFTDGSVLDDPTVRLELVAGAKLDEFAMVVARGDGTTLVLNDILSRIAHPPGLGAQIMARLFGFGVHRPRTSRLVRRMFVADGKAVAAQFRAWAALPDLRRVIVSHVDVIDCDPAAALRRAADDY